MFNKSKHNRQSIRLKGYDYSQEGFYFITICTQNRECVFGRIVDGEMILNDFGQMVQNEWLNTEQLRPNIKCHAFVVMPDHFHCVLEIVNSYSKEDYTVVGAYCNTPPQVCNIIQPRHDCNKPTQKDDSESITFKSPSQTIGAIIRGFKGATTKQINIARNSPSQKVWQRGYWDRIIRTQREFDNVERYIENNPKTWQLKKLQELLQD